MSDPIQIVHVDTDSRVLAAAQEAFARAGFAYTGVDNPAKAMEAALRASPTVILLEIDLPKGSGYSLLKALHSDPQTAPIPIILLSSRDLSASVVSAFRAGVVDFLSKPFAPEHVEKVREILAGLHLRNGRIEAPVVEDVVERLLLSFRRTKKSGVLVVNGGTPDQALAAFAQGQLQTCEAFGLRGKEALKKLLAITGGTYRFEEMDRGSSDLILETPDSNPELDQGLTLEEEELSELDIDIVEVAPEEALASEGVSAPAVRSDNPQPPAPRPTVSQVDAIGGTQPKVLLVDDDPTLLKMFGTLLRKCGFAVSMSFDGQAGYERALAERPDIVVADLNMPRLDGWGLLKRIRADHRVAETPLVFLSCHDDYRETLKGLAAGAQDYLPKTLKIDVITKRLSETLSPRYAFLGAAVAGKADGRVEKIGVQWVLSRLAQAGRSGTLMVHDGWADHSFFLRAGKPAYASTQMGHRQVFGKAAVARLLGARSGDLSYSAATSIPESNLSGELGPLLDEAASENNRAETEAIDLLLTGTGKAQVDPELFHLYSSLGPPMGRDVAARLATGLSPKAILADSAVSPLELEELFRDLLRRGVVTMQAA